MDEYEFAKFFVIAKQDKIKQKLQIKHLYTENIIQIVYTFIIEHKKEISDKFVNQYDSLKNKNFFKEIITVLQIAKKNGTSMEINL